MTTTKPTKHLQIGEHVAIRAQDLVEVQTVDLVMPESAIIDFESDGVRYILSQYETIEQTAEGTLRRFHFCLKGTGVLILDEGSTVLFHGKASGGDYWFGDHTIYLFEERNAYGQPYGVKS